MNRTKALILLSSAIAGISFFMCGVLFYAALWQWIFAQPYFPQSIHYNADNRTLVVAWMSSLSFGTARYYGLWPLYSSVYGNLERYNRAWYALLPFLSFLFSSIFYRKASTRLITKAQGVNRGK